MKLIKMPRLEMVKAIMISMPAASNGVGTQGMEVQYSLQIQDLIQKMQVLIQWLAVRIRFIVLLRESTVSFNTLL